MNRLLVAALFSVQLALAPTALALAQAPAGAESLQGRLVRDVKGVVLGTVERVILAADGRPAQVLVRPQWRAAAGLRSLSVAGLTRDEGGLITPLTKAEFDAMPAVELEEN